MTAPTARSLVLRLGPCIAYGGPDGTTILATSALAWLETDRLRLYDNAQPTPGLLLDVPVADIDLDLGRLPRDRTVTVTSPDGTGVLLTAQPGGCACAGGGMLRGWVPPP